MAEHNTSVVTGGLGNQCTSSLVVEDSREAVPGDRDCTPQLGLTTSSVATPKSSERTHSGVPRVRQLRERKANKDDMMPIEKPQRGKKTKATGKSKVPWSKNERIILWEWYILEAEVKDLVDISKKLKTCGEKWAPMKEQPQV